MIKFSRIIALMIIIAAVFTACPPPEVGNEPGDEPKDDPGEITVEVTDLVLSNTGTVTVEMEDTLQLDVDVTPDNYNTGLTWESSDVAIALVSATGLVTPVATGEVTIKVFSTIDPSISSECTLVVIPAGSAQDNSLVLYNQNAAPDGATTTVLPPFINGKMVIVSDDGDARINSSGPNNVTMVYYNQAATGNFTIRARVLVTNDLGYNPSTSKGATIGAYTLTDEGTLSTVTDPVDPLLFSTMMVRTTNGGDRRGYSTKGDVNDGVITSEVGTSSPEENGADVPLSIERIYQVERNASGITLSVFASNTDFSGTPEALASGTLLYLSDDDGTSTLLNQNLVATTPMYLGFTVMGATLEISNLVITGDGIDDFASDPVDARPVPVNSVTVSGETRNPIDDGAGNILVHYQNTLAAAREDIIQLSATVVPDFAEIKTVTWSSDDEAVATVDQTGLVTVIGAGDTTIRATADDGTGLQGRFVIRLTADVVYITDITIGGSSSLLTPNTEAYTAVISPADATVQTVTWTSDDPAIASVDAAGNVTAVSVGTTTIRALADDGNGAEGSIVISVAAGDSVTWSFTDLPADWPEQDVALAASTAVTSDTADIILLNGLAINLFDDGDGKGSRSTRWAVPSERSAPDGTGFSDGCLQPNGGGLFGILADLQGPFSISISYVHTSSSGTGRIVRISVDGGVTFTDGPATNGYDPMILSYTYDGTDIVTADLYVSGGIRIFDIVLTQ